ncbi:hypothetical protein EC988_006937 [Linderina pennispora]|nr:hypothetical protein EC988_006937 [Linderina pennispora]
MSAIIGMLMRLGYHEIDLYKDTKPKTWGEWVEVETKRRIFWTVFQHDSFMSLINGLPTMIPESSIFVKSPCADSDWNDIEFPLLYSTDGKLSVSEELAAIQRGSSEKSPLHDLSPERELVYSVKRKTKLVSEYPLFRQFDAQLRDLHERVKPPKHLAEFSYDEDSVQRFGSQEYGLSIMRARYVVITAFTCSTTVILHSNNRASFFTEFEQPHEGQADPNAAALKQVMATMFGKVWSQGLLATDIEPESWDICVRSSHTLAGYLRSNQDIPSIRIEKMVCISIIINSSVLLRQIRRCKAALRDADDSEMSLNQWQQELDRSTQNVKSMWDALLRLSEAWNLDGVTQVLKMMDTDDAINAADQLSSLSL